MEHNVIRTGVSLDKPCPEAPDDGWEWMPVAIYGEWRLLRGGRKAQLREGEAAIQTLDSDTPEVVPTKRTADY